MYDVYTIDYQKTSKGTGLGAGGDTEDIGGYEGFGQYTMADNRVRLEGAEDPDVGSLVEMLDRFFSKGDWR